jgi:proteasome accessory factor BC
MGGHGMAVAEVPDGAVLVEWAVKGADYLVRDVLNEAGDAVVLKPADARDAALAAAERLLVTP